MTARVDAVVYFRVDDPIKAIILAENYFDSTFRISQSTLRDVLGTKSLSEILSDREAISEHIGVSYFNVGNFPIYHMVTTTSVRVISLSGLSGEEISFGTD